MNDTTRKRHSKSKNEQDESINIILQELKQAEQDGRKADDKFMDSLIYELEGIEKDSEGF